MDDIIITNTIDEDIFYIDFDLNDGSISFPALELSTFGDIELNPLVIKLTELLELNRKIEIKYEDSQSLLESDPKIKLVKETLDEIYDSFNSNIVIEDDVEDLL
jgi:hypothetical protein